MSWGKDSNISREVYIARKEVADGLRWSGSLMLCRQAWTMADSDAGLVKSCPDCWDEELKNSNNSRCKRCFGTGWDGGYRPAFVVRAFLQNNANFHNAKSNNTGYIWQEDTTLRLACDGHFYGSGDLFAEVTQTKNGVPTQIGRVFKASGASQRQVIHGLISNDNPDAIMNIDDRAVSQQLSVKLLLVTDFIVLNSADFWGVESVLNPPPTQVDTPVIDSCADRYHSSSWDFDW